MMSSFSSMWLRTILSVPVPFWLFLFVLSLGILAAIELYRYLKISADLRKRHEVFHSQRKEAEVLVSALEARQNTLEATIHDLRAEKNSLEQQIAELTEVHAEKHRLEQRLAALTSSEPRLSGVWSNSQTFWHVDPEGKERAMQIGGRIHLTSSNTDEVLYILAGYIEGQRLDLCEPVSVRPDLIEDEQVVLWTSSPLAADATQSFNATIVLEDQQNRLHTLPRHSFRPTEQSPPWPSKDS